MEEAVGDLVLAPFRDIISQANLAIENAAEGRDDGMVEAAQSLAREGRRALNKIEPLCLKNYDEHGSAFVDALKDNDEISLFIENLNNLLYDFEEYVDPESFDAEKFTELQGLSRKAVLRISHIIVRMKLAPSHPDQDLESVSSSLAADAAAMVRRRSSDDVTTQRRESLPYPEDMEPEVKYATMPYPPPGPNPDLEPRRADSPCVAHLPSVQEEEPPPPPPPFLDPWSLGFLSPSEEPGQPRDTATSSDSALGSSNNSDYNSSPMVTDHGRPPQPPSAVPPRSPHHIVTRGRGDGISPVPPGSNLRDSVGSFTNASARSSVSDPRRETFDMVSPVSPMNRTSGYSLDPQAQVPPLFTRPGTLVLENPPNEGLERVVFPTRSVPDGLIPVEEDVARPTSPPPDLEAQLGGCGINLDSSYYRFRGFCPGAMEITQGGLGIKHIKKQGLATGNIEVAKCKSCAYELEWKAVERDVNNEGKYPPGGLGAHRVPERSRAPSLTRAATENFKSAGIGFRLRFLSKSHIHTKNVGDQIYGCLFCVQLRQTTHPNDATIFFSQRQLFAHLARHPHPLPYVPGLAVVQAEEVPAQSANNYDLHFSRPPRQTHLAGVERELTELPTATALQTCRPTATLAMRRPADGAEVLCFAAGARILGVEFPDKYHGEWCLGWADHEHGLLPADAIRLDPPRRREARDRALGSSMRAVARWKFSAREGRERGAGDWLSFGRGEVITNIGWSHQEHWCWWGTNSKGKSGLFPRSHIQPGTLMEAATKSDRASISGDEKRTSLLSKISTLYLRNGSSGGGGGGEGGGGGRGSTSPRTFIH